MKALFCATIYRVKKSMGMKISIAMICLAAVLYYLLASMLARGTFDMSQAGSITGLADPMILWIFGPLMIAIMIGNDFENKTIHVAIKYGRKRIIMNYLLVSAMLVVLMVFPYIIGSVACIVSEVDMSGAESTMVSIYMENVLGYDSEIGVGKLALSYLTSAVVYIGQLSICIPVAIKIKKPVVVTAFGVFFGMITALLATLASKVNLLDYIYKLTPYHYGVGKIGIDAEVTTMFAGIIVSLCFTIIMGVVAWLLLKKCDIK